MFSLSRKYIKDNIEFETEYWEYPDLNGICSLTIKPTGTLEKEADRIRVDEGFLPCFNCDGPYNENDWYDFWVVFNKQEILALEFVISGDVVVYSIDIDSETENYLLDELKIQLGETWEEIWG